MTVLHNSFHLNGHTLGFHPQTKKLQPHILTQGLTLGVKELNGNKKSGQTPKTVFHLLPLMNDFIAVLCIQLVLNKTMITKAKCSGKYKHYSS